MLERRGPDIAGERVVPFFTEGDEGFSIDYPDDWVERAAADGPDCRACRPTARGP